MSDVQNERLRELTIELRIAQRSYLETRLPNDLQRSREIAERIDQHLFCGKKIMPNLKIEPDIEQLVLNFFK